MADLFNVTSKLKEAVDSLNGVKTPKFALLLAKLIKAIGTRREAFNADERQKLVDVLQFENEAAVDTALGAANYIYEQALYYEVEPGVLRTQLRKIGMTETSVEAFANVYSENREEVLTALREKTVAPVRMARCDWRLHLALAQRDKTNIKEARVILNMDLDTDAHASDAHGVNARSHLRLEFTHDELSDFYAQLQRIQEQMDALHT